VNIEQIVFGAIAFNFMLNAGAVAGLYFFFVRPISDANKIEPYQCVHCDEKTHGSEVHICACCNKTNID